MSGRSPDHQCDPVPGRDQLADDRVAGQLTGDQQPAGGLGGRVGPPAAGLPEEIPDAVARVRDELSAHPFQAPEADRLAGLGLGRRELAAAVQAGVLVRIADGVVLAPDAPDRAARILAGLAQPFTLSQARQALDTTRRIAVPLLELLDSRGLTRRLPGDRRTVRHEPEQAPVREPAALD